MKQSDYFQQINNNLLQPAYLYPSLQHESNSNGTEKTVLGQQKERISSNKSVATTTVQQKEERSSNRNHTTAKTRVVLQQEEEQIKGKYMASEEGGDKTQWEEGLPPFMHKSPASSPGKSPRQSHFVKKLLLNGMLNILLAYLLIVTLHKASILGELGFTLAKGSHYVANKPYQPTFVEENLLCESTNLTLIVFLNGPKDKISMQNKMANTLIDYNIVWMAFSASMNRQTSDIFQSLNASVGRIPIGEGEVLISISHSISEMDYNSNYLDNQIEPPP